MAEEYRDEERCRECSGKCCRIYGDPEEGCRPTDLYFEEWCEQFFEGCDLDDIVPFFDPLWTHMTGHEQEAEELLQRGIDHKYCQYRDPQAGCIIPWNRRPSQCREYRCQKWKEEDKAVLKTA